MLDMYLFRLGQWGVRFLRRSIDLLALNLHTGASMRDTIIISGTPRGGTTWFMDLIESLPEYRSIFEPFHREWFPQVKQLNLPPRPYFKPSAENKLLKEYLEQVFTGQIISRAPFFSLTPTTIYSVY